MTMDNHLGTQMTFSDCRISTNVPDISSGHAFAPQQLRVTRFAMPIANAGGGPSQACGTASAYSVAVERDPFVDVANDSSNRVSQNATTDIERRNQLIVEHISLVKAIACRVKMKLPHNVELNDLVQAGMLGLVAAAGKYDLTKQIAFPAYANFRIRGAMLDSLRQLDSAPRSVRRQHRRIVAATEELATSLRQTPSDVDVAEKLGMDVKDLRKTMLDLQSVSRVSIFYFNEKDEDAVTRDFPCEKKFHPDSMAGRAQVRSALRDAMSTLPERDQKILALYHRYSLSMAQIAKQCGVNESRISQIHKAALAKMRVVLEAKGIRSSPLF